jgi:hypothetical protein
MTPRAACTYWQRFLVVASATDVVVVVVAEAVHGTTTSVVPEITLWRRLEGGTHGGRRNEPSKSTDRPRRCAVRGTRSN